MTELERHPQAVRQSAAAAVVALATVSGMSAMASRGAEQRDDAAWAERSAAVSGHLEQEMAALDLRPGLAPEGVIAPFQIAADDGYRLRARAIFGPSAFDRSGFLIHASLTEPSPLLLPQTRRPALVSPETSVAHVALSEAREKRCLAEAIYFEARGESRAGQLAVAEVVANRVRSKHYPDSFCGVVYQGSKRRTGCQFSFTCDGSLNKKPRGAPWRQAQAIASQVVSGHVPQLTERATHYHTTAVSPHWRWGLVETTRIGSHIFYRFPNRSERAILANARAGIVAAEAAAPADVNAAADPVIRVLPEAEGEPAGDLPAEVMRPAPKLTPDLPPATTAALEEKSLPVPARVHGEIGA